MRCVMSSWLLCLVCLGGSGALAAEAKKSATPAQPTREAMVENHRRMAEMHAGMAACLATEKTIAQCRKEMVDKCSTSFGGSCPWMGGGGRPDRPGRPGMGMMGGRGMGYWDGGCMGWSEEPGK